MKKLVIIGVFLGFLITACASLNSSKTNVLGHFNPKKDLLLVQFDCKTDVDDLHSVAGLATLLNNKRFKGVNYHAVAGSYGVQGGLYVPANELFQHTFDNRWSDAHTNRDKALTEVTQLVTQVLKKGGHIWIAEAGQSDFSADMVSNIQSSMPDMNTKELIHIVQHSDWNEEVTGKESLDFVKTNTEYHKIADGNAANNGTPQLRSDGPFDWQSYVSNARLTKSWNMAIDLGNQYNGKEGRYENKSITNGGLDFSDISEVCWIFGFEHLKDYSSFFQEFSAK